MKTSPHEEPDPENRSREIISPDPAPDNRGDDIACYTSAAGDGYFGWTDARNDTPEQLAARFVERFPDLVENGAGEDPAYAAWYATMLSVAEGGALPVAYSDYDEDLDPGRMATTDSRVTLPSPPPGEGPQRDY